VNSLSSGALNVWITHIQPSPKNMSQRMASQLIFKIRANPYHCHLQWLVHVQLPSPPLLLICVSNHHSAFNLPLCVCVKVNWLQVARLIIHTWRLTKGPFKSWFKNCKTRGKELKNAIAPKFVNSQCCCSLKGIDIDYAFIDSGYVINYLCCLFQIG